MHQEYSKGKFHIVATPIGNSKDISIRALEVLQSVDIILCEDTRVTLKLLNLYGVSGKKLLICNSFNETEHFDYIKDSIEQGKNIALVSDAGTPLISDPGCEILNLLRTNKIKYTSIPGASSVTVALSLCGFNFYEYFFTGFLPTKDSARKEKLYQLKKMQVLFVFFESPNRIIETLETMVNIFGDNYKISVMRELTKLYEEIITDNICNIIEHLKNKFPNGRIKGEFVAVCPVLKENDDNLLLKESDLEKIIIEKLNSNLKTKEIANYLTINFGLDKKESYNKVVEIKQNVQQN